MHGFIRNSSEPVQAGTVDTHPDIDAGAWLRTLREIPGGIVTEADFLAWLDGPLRRFFPFEKFFGAYGYLSGGRVHMRSTVSTGHEAGFMASRASTVDVNARACVAWWLSHRRGLVLDRTFATDAAGARIALSEIEIDDINRYGLGALAQNGVIDPFANTAVHLGFSGVPKNRLDQTLAALELITPVVYALYFRTRAVAPAALRLNSLTDRQRDLVDLAALGLSDKAIASRLGISENTVGNHLRAIYAKLGISKRGHLVALVK
ncbi:MAG TPA: helix-turn-helix transcriptional regulator [Bradyrhizobium sp.]|nr:helix-turn-helix transcriptional regulator [Bradyrhizobium sp.]